MKSPGFDDAGWPKSLDARDLIVDSLAFRIRFKPKLKIIPGEPPVWIGSFFFRSLACKA